ncbi:hypothetical protein [Methylomonas sp. MK1]|uniref:hypothetical protein n=1 Tax=Methylomonas sp. MK1 TaxID=1131552 RepID=UPI00126839F3|nr:hypothetical protein [Methylomonas sp. MK1]
MIIAHLPAELRLNCGTFINPGLKFPGIVIPAKTQATILKGRIHSGLAVSVSAVVVAIAVTNKATKTIPNPRAGIIKKHAKIGNRQPLS